MTTLRRIKIAQIYKQKPFYCIFATIMRKILAILTIFFLGGILPATAQVDPTQQKYDEFGNPVDKFGNKIDPSTLPKNLKDSTEEILSLEPKLFMWQISERFGNSHKVSLDTVFVNFHSTNLDEGMRNRYSHIGNMGSPRISILYSDRQDKEIPFFMRPYSNFYFKPSEHRFTNSNIPYTNLTYYKAGNKVNGEDYFKSYFSVNVNKRLAFGFNINYLYGRGYYNHQSTAFFNGGVFGSYRGDKYQAYFMYNNFMTKMAENGGITDDRYITNPVDMSEGKTSYESQNIPTHLSNAWNRNSNFYIFLNHRYNIGFRRETKVVTKKAATNEINDLKPKANLEFNDSIGYNEDLDIQEALTETIKQEEDSIITEFVPVTSFIHTFKVERSKHRFISRNEPTDYFPNTYINIGENQSDDINTYVSFKNTLGISLNEGFNKIAKAGLMAFASYKVDRYTLPTKDITREAKYVEGILFVGAEMARRTGKYFNFRALADFGLSQNYTGNFNLEGDVDLRIPIRKDTLFMSAFAKVSNNRPEFYLRHYHANHYYWDEGRNGMPKFKNEFAQKLGGSISFPKWTTKLSASLENIKNYTYLGGKGTPLQYSDNIQIASASFNQNFKLGIFHLDNEVTWQKSSNNNVIPVPSLALYHNLYIKTTLAKKVLLFQFGADVRYSTKYKGLAYMPGIQQFHTQDSANSVDIGGYPMINVYANFHLKQTRIFVMMYHVNQGMGNSNYFLAPHYPINPRLFKIGISWNFYD